MNNAEHNELTIIIGADILPTPSNYDLFSSGNISELLGSELWNEIEKADFRVFNLEGPLTNEKDPILKDGPVLEAPENTIAGFAAMKTDLLAMSNNHIRDHGTRGIQNSLKLAKNYGIACIGVGTDYKERSQPYFYQTNGIRIGFYNCCENEESVTDDGEYSANPYDALNSFDDVQCIKKECDFLIVLYHGGKECFRYPSPMLMRRFRKFAEKGADIVIAQHTHCIGCYENYQGSLLLYGQGNFIFDKSDDEYSDNGLLLKIKFMLNKNSKYQYQFLPIQKRGNVVRIADQKKAAAIMNALKERSLKLQDEAFILEEYNKKADAYITFYLNGMQGRSIIGKLLRKIFKRKLDKYWIKCMYPPKVAAHMKNYISCEAHHELLVTGLNGIINGRWHR